jgi:hypothetical protein
VADQEVVDQLAASAVDPGVPLGFGDECREVPESGRVTGVGLVVAERADLGAGWAQEDLGGRGLGLVVEVATTTGRCWP